MSETITFCKTTKGNKWYIFGFRFDHKKDKWSRIMVLYDKVKVWHRRNDLLCVDVPISVKDMFLSDNNADVNMAITIVETAFKENHYLLELNK